MPVLVTPEIPDHLTTPLPGPVGELRNNRHLLDLLLDYEALRRRANADRAAIRHALEFDVGDE